QSLAQSWLVLTLTHSALALGIVGALQFLPVLLLSAFGGLIADRAPKRNVLLGTQTAQMVLAFVLAVLTAQGRETYTIVLLLALLLGIANAVDMPTRQAFVVELVGPEDLANAIALNSALFNAARLVGPALAGVLIGIVGIAGCFYINGASFLAVILGLLLIAQPAVEPRHFESFQDVWNDLEEGFQYVRHAGSVRAVILITGAVGMFAANFNVVTPILAQNVLQVGPTGLGLLMAAMGVGSLFASIGMAYFGNNPHPRAVAISGVTLAILDMALAPIRSYSVALALLVLIGAAMVVLSATANSYVQLTVPNRLRGRVMSLYTTVFVGTTPIGNTLAGALAETTQAFGPLFYGGFAALLATIWLSIPLTQQRPPSERGSEEDFLRPAA
ncbi:MAG TPA: MFS transporter, partial [Chloroflexota bacterium]|nr:MFS transporter [Chloroflexota bacterium]